MTRNLEAITPSVRATLATRKRRGAETQRAVANYLAEHGWRFATDVGAGRTGSDILNTPGVAWEVKARANFDPAAWVRQAAKHKPRLNGKAVVVFRPNGLGRGQVDKWLAMMTLADVVELLRAAGYGDGLDT